MLLLPTTSALKRREVPATVFSFSVSATNTTVFFASILLLLLRLRRDACRKKTKNITFSFWVAALLLLFTHREGCAGKNKIGFCFLFETGTQSIAVSVTRYVLLLFLTAPGSCCRLPCRPALCVCPSIDYYRDTQHGAMEPWTTSIHKKHRILRGFVVSEQPLLYSVYGTYVVLASIAE